MVLEDTRFYCTLNFDKGVSLIKVSGGEKMKINEEVKDCGEDYSSRYFTGLGCSGE
jgi:hypothetical protein